MEIASEEILTRLCASLQCFMDLDVAYSLSSDIQDFVIEVSISNE